MLFAFLAALVLASTAAAASAAELGGRVDKWSPHGKAPLSGWTTVKASENLGSSPMTWGPSRRYRARNNKTVFGMQDDYGAVVKISRNKFFRVLGSYKNNVSITWKWRGREGSRYRFIVRICAIHAGA
jgi:hypothetical protein